jgi:hypothetical protein
MWITSKKEKRRKKFLSPLIDKQQTTKCQKERNKYCFDAKK